MKTLPIGEQSLVKIIEGNSIYVDKTKWIYQLMHESRYYFLSRPRRFGKSLLIDTLDQIFSGNQTLFQDLWIYDQIEWEQHPIIRLDFSSLDYKTQSLNDAISQELRQIATNHGMVIDGIGCKTLFRDLIEQLSTRNDVVILIDEYDKPITDFLTDVPQALDNRDTLREFFGILKFLNDKIRLLFITGISKFARVSLFSALNNLDDLTLQQGYATLTGITSDELSHYFDDYLQRIVQRTGITMEVLFDQIKEMYNGYSWDGEHFVYNPFSLLKFLKEGQFENHWFKTGTPAFLIDLLKKEQVSGKELEELLVDGSVFDTFDISEHLDVYSLLFQTGYLTIKKVERYGTFLEYTLSFPNNEVRRSFTNHLLQAYTNKKPTVVGSVVARLKHALFKADIEEMQKQLNVLFSDIAYHLFPLEKKEKTTLRARQEFKAWEGYFQTVIYLVLQYLGVQIQCEINKHRGRLDAVVEVKDYIYIMEFKLEDAQAALQQIKDRKYAQSYQNKGKKVLLLGIAFDQKEREVKDIEWEEYGEIEK